MAFRFFPRNNNPEVVQFQIFVLPLQLNQAMYRFNEYSDMQNTLRSFGNRIADNQIWAGQKELGAILTGYCRPHVKTDV